MGAPEHSHKCTLMGLGQHHLYYQYHTFISIYVMLIFMCQLDWATRCPDIGPNIILGVSVRVFLDEIYI